MDSPLIGIARINSSTLNTPLNLSSNQSCPSLTIQSGTVLYEIIFHWTKIYTRYGSSSGSWQAWKGVEYTNLSQDSISRFALGGVATKFTASASASNNHLLRLAVESSLGKYMLIVTTNGIALYDSANEVQLKYLHWEQHSISQGIQNTAFTGDLDTLTSSMVCYCGNASTNTPTNQGGGLIVMNAGGAKLQLFVLNAEPGKLYFRRFFNGEWKSWQTLVQAI